MPPKKKVEVVKIESENIDTDSENETITKPKAKPMLISSNTSDNSRVKLANAINNLTIKSDEFMNMMKGFDVFRESIIKLDIEMESKKIEHDDFIMTLEKNQKNRLKELDNDYNDKNKDLTNKHNELIKKTNDDFIDFNKKLENEYKNKQIKINQDLMEYKLKACETLAKENGYILYKQVDKDLLEKDKSIVEQNYKELKDKFDSECNKIRHSEDAKYKNELKNAMAMFELKVKADTADMKAQVEQQKREIEVLNNTISNLKNELVEQRNLTKEVAQASSKSQITQKFGKE